MAFTDHRLKFVIDADGKAARRELVDVDNMIGRMGAGLGSLAGPAAIAASGVAVIGAAAVAGGAALFNLSKQASEFGSTIFDASKKTGLGAESLSAMKFAADQSGSSLEQITGGIAKFSKTVGEAADGSDKAAAKLKDFGLTPQEAIGDLDAALGKVFQRIIAAPAGIERMTLAQKAFGKSGADLLPFIDSFNGDLTSLIKKAKELGVTISDEDARAADEFGDQLDTLNAQLSSVGRTIGLQVMPVFNEMASDISDWLSKNKNEVTNWGDAFALAMGNAYRNLNLIVDFIRDNQDWFRVGLSFAGPAGTAIGAGIGHFGEQMRRREEQRQSDQAGAVDLSGLTPEQRQALSPLGVVRYGDDDAGEAGKANEIKVGRADSQSDFDRRNKQYLDNIARESRAAIDNERQTVAERVELREAEYDQMFSVAERYATDVGRTEEELAKYRHDLDEQLLEFRKETLREYVEFLKNSGPEGADALRTAEHQLQLLEKSIETQRNTYAANEKKRQAAALEDEKKLRAERNRSWNEYVRALGAAATAQNALDYRQSYERGTVMGGTGIGGSIGEGLGVDLVPIFDEATNSMLSFQDHLGLVRADINDFVGNALGGMIDGLAQMGAAWFATGEFSAQAALQMLSATAFSIAGQAAIKAVFEAAESVAAYARYDFVAGSMHAAAATMYSTVAVVAAGAGVGLGLAARAVGGGKGGSKGSERDDGSSSSTGRVNNENLQPISRVSDDAYISGRRDAPAFFVARAVEKLIAKIEGMPPDAVLVKGAERRRGIIADQFIKDVKHNSARGSTAARAMGFK